MLLNDFDSISHSLGMACYLENKQRTRLIGIPTPLVSSDELWTDDYVRISPLIDEQISQYNEHKKTNYRPDIYTFEGDTYYKVDSLIARFIRGALYHKYFLVTLEHVDYGNHLFKLVCYKRRLVKDEEDEYEV